MKLLIEVYDLLFLRLCLDHSREFLLGKDPDLVSQINVFERLPLQLVLKYPLLVLIEVVLRVVTSLASLWIG